MRYRYFILPFFLIQLFISSSFAQLWYITRGLSTDDEAWAVAVDSAGFVYWAVEEKNQWPFWYFNIFLFKIDSTGHQIWQSAPYGGTYNELAYIANVHGNKVYLGGRTDTFGAIDSADALVVCYNTSDGSLNWDYRYDQGFGYEEVDGLLIQPDGIYFTGWTKGQTTDMDFLIQKINFSGQQVWSTSYDYNGLGKFDGANGHSVIDNTFIYVAGHVNRTNILSFDGDMGLVCFNRSTGAYQWNVTWGGPSFDDALGMTMSADSMLYIVGYTASFGNGSQIYLNKYSRTGQLQWSRIWGGSGGEVARSLVADGDSIVYVVGTTPSYGNGGKDIVVLKYDSGGTLKDSLLWGGVYDEVAKDVVMYGDYLYITGETQSFGNGQISGDHKRDGLLLKVNGRTMQAPDTLITNVEPTHFLPKEYILHQNYPNPFNPSTTIRFSLPHRSHVILKVFDILGREMTTLIDGELNAGEHSVVFDASNLSSGAYFYRLQAGSFVQQGKMEMTK